ncbi:hypothetical protein FCOIX_3122 [Fusarium coicis]|nr:hypothetical protein FCOIX_3122 [Fusarium coicis]
MSSSRATRAARRPNQRPVARFTQPVLYRGEHLPFGQGFYKGRLWSSDKQAELDEKLKNVNHPYFSSNVSDVVWSTHTYDMWQAFNAITYKDCLLGDSVIALLRTATYGIENAVTVAPFHIEISSNIAKRNEEWGDKKSPYLPPHYAKVDCLARLGYFETIDARRKLFGIRFLVGCIRHADYNHWTSFIFDRKKGNLYHSDSYLYDQKIRLTNAIVGFREFLAGIALPFSFSYYQIPISGQPSQWECGLIAAYCVIKAIRGLVCVTQAEAVSVHRKESLNLDVGQGQQAEPYDLLLSDWVLDLENPGVTLKTKISRNLNFLKAFFQQSILMDLGVPDNKYLEYIEGSDQPELCEIEHPGSIQFRQLFATGPYPIEERYTSESGYISIWSANVKYISSYDQHRIMLLMVCSMII